MIVNILIYTIILMVFWLMKPLSDGVYLIWTLPSFIITKIFKERKEFKIMTKTDLLREISSRIDGTTQKDIAVVLDVFEQVVVDTLKKDTNETVSFGKLGKFKVKTVPERRGKIMMGDRKGEEYVTPQHEEICFKMSKSAKQL